MAVWGLGLLLCFQRGGDYFLVRCLTKLPGPGLGSGPWPQWTKRSENEICFRFLSENPERKLFQKSGMLKIRYAKNQVY